MRRYTAAVMDNRCCCLRKHKSVLLNTPFELQVEHNECKGTARGLCLGDIGNGMFHIKANCTGTL